MKFLLLMSCLTVKTVLFAQSFSGKVIDSNTNKGIPFASVFITEVELGTTCDSLGNFEFISNLPNYFTLRISATFYETQSLSATPDINHTIALIPKHLSFDDIIVSSPLGGNARQNAYRIDKLSINELNSIKGSNLSEAISNIAGVQNASQGTGNSKPVIRGMQGVRILTVLNGMRIEGQQWGGDHGMAIGQLGLGSVEVIKGPSSLLYGSDALGGVLFLVDAPYAKINQLEVTASTSFESVDLNSTSSIMLKSNKGPFRFSLGALMSESSDFQAPNGDYLNNSRYSEKGIKFSMGFNKENWVSHLRYTYGQNIYGVPGEEHEEEHEAEHEESFLVGSQKRGRLLQYQKIDNHLISWENKFFIGKHTLEILAGNTFNHFQEFEDLVDTSALNLKLNNSLVNIKFNYSINPSWKLITGTQAMMQVNVNDPIAEERLIPDFIQLDGGLFSILSYKRKDWNIQSGVRYDLRSLTVKDSSFSSIYQSPNFSFGVVNSKSLRTFRLNISTGFRAPHLTELMSNGEHHGAARYEVGDANLVSERATQMDASMEFHLEHFEFIINPYFNRLQNYISLEKTDQYIGDLPVYTYNRFSNANLYGSDFGVHYHPHFAHWLHLETSYSYIRGEQLNGESLGQIPQNKLNTFLKANFNMKQKIKLEAIVLQHEYYSIQSHVSDFETTTNDYQLFNIASHFLIDIKTPLKINLGIKNIFNVEYYNHLSRLKNLNVFHPGRSFYVSMTFDIKSNLN